MSRFVNEIVLVILTGNFIDILTFRIRSIAFLPVIASGIKIHYENRYCGGTVYYVFMVSTHFNLKDLKRSES